MTDADQTPTWDELDLAAREGYIRRPLVVIRKAWPLEAPAPAGSSGRGAPASRIPTNVDALTVRAEITRDLAFWCRALLEDHPEGFPAEPEPYRVPVPTTDPRALAPWQILVDRKSVLDLSDVPAMIDQLIREARWAAGWSKGWEMQSYLADLARDASLIAWPRDRGILAIGSCPNTIGVEGEVVTCGATVRATVANLGDVKCKGCGLSDTIDGWILRIVGDEPLVTAEQLVVILHKRLGVVVKPGTVAVWKHRGQITARGQDDRGRDLFDRQDALTLVTMREAL